MANTKDETLRQEAITGNLWKMVLEFSLPLAFYSILSQVYNIADSIMASHIDSSSVNAISYLTDINNVLNCVAMALGTGASILIAKAYGAGKYKLVTELVSTVMAVGACGCLILLLCISFSESVMRLFGTPEELIEIGKSYFSINLGQMAFYFMNTLYFSIERARGNTRRIFIISTMSMILKISLTAYFIYGLNSKVDMMALASLISQAFVFCFPIYHFSRKETAFRFDIREITFKKDISGPVVKLTFPVLIEKITFSVGKVWVNAMCTFYGNNAVGAMGVSNRVSGLFNMAQSGFGEGSSALIGQNIGAGEKQRAVDTVKRTLTLLFFYSCIATVIAHFVVEPAAVFFATSQTGFDQEFYEYIKTILTYEVTYSVIPFSLFYSFLGFLYAYGKTKLVTLVNLVRLLVLRAGLFWFLQQFTDLGVEAAGIVQVVSNAGSSVLMAIVGCIVIHKYCKENHLIFIFGKKEKTSC